MAADFRTKLRQKFEPMKEKIKESYLNFVINHGKRPDMMLRLAEALEAEERELYAHYASLTAIERDLMADIFTQTTTQLEAEAVYEAYNSREKLLAIAYTWLEVMKAQRSVWVAISAQGERKAWIQGAEKPFEIFVKSILNEGIARQEIAERLWISDYNAKLLWWTYTEIIAFWLRDDSPNFERTDAYVEKSLSFLLDLIQPNFFDSGFSWLKWQFS